MIKSNKNEQTKVENYRFFGYNFPKTADDTQFGTIIGNTYKIMIVTRPNSRL